MYGHEFSYGKPRSPRMNSGAYCHPRNEVTSSRTATCTRHSHLPLTRGSFKSRKANATAPSPLLYTGLLWGVHRVNANIKKPFLRCLLMFAVLWAIKNCMQFYNFHFPLWPGNAGRVNWLNLTSNSPLVSHIHWREELHCWNLSCSNSFSSLLI